MKLATAEQARRIDARAIAAFGVPGVALMETAGAGAAALAWSRFRTEILRGVVVLAGKGNNGGDGFVVARHLAARGARVQVVLIGARLADLTSDARTMADVWRRSGGITRPTPRGLAAVLRDAGLVVDALLGTGLSSAPRGPIAAAIAALATVTGAEGGSETKVLALDVPSGLDASTGETPGACVRADLTATFGLGKPGLLSFPGARAAGEVRVVRIGWPRAAVDAERLRCSTITAARVRRWLPSLDVETHKGQRGHVLVIAGRDDRPGAAVLATRAAFRAGAGSVTIASTGAASEQVVAACPEVMAEPLPAARGEISIASVEHVAALVRRADAILVGPGLGLGEGPAAILELLLAQLPRGTRAAPVVADADALTLLARRGARAARNGRALVLTPHPGEAARLTGTTTAVVQACRIAAARLAAERHGAIVVLKGARTLVAAPGGWLAVNLTGNAGLATAGAGDVLAGVIAAWLARGLTPYDAARAAAFVHGSAADRAAAEIGPVGFLAGDVADRIPFALP